MMDLKIKGSKWVGNIYQKFEAVCHEVDDMVKQDTFKYVEDQMQSVGDNVKKVCSNLLPHLGNSVKPVAEDVASEKIVEPVLSKLMSPDGEEPFSEFSYGEFAQSDHVNRPADLSEQKSSRDCLHDGAECVSDDPIKMYPGQQLSFFSSQHNHVEKLGSPASKDTIMRSESESSDVNIKEFSTILYASVWPDANSSSVVELFTESPMRVFDQRNDTDRHAELSKNKPGTSTHEMSIESLQNWTLWDDYVDEVERVPDALQSTSKMSFSVVSTENTGEGATLASFIRYDAEESSIISEGLPENLNHEEICCHNSVDGASIVAKFSDAAHETFEHSLECQLDSAALDADDSNCDSVDSSVVCSVVSEDTSIKKIGMTSFNCSSAEPVGLSEGPSEKLLREAILFKYVDDSSSDVAYSHTESIELHDKVQIQENCLNVEDSVLRAISQRVRKQRSLKKQILDAFTSKKRLAKEYEQLAIWFGDASLDSSQETNPHENNSGTHQAGDSEWELL